LQSNLAVDARHFPDVHGRSGYRRS
jgi:hypothetical protein